MVLHVLNLFLKISRIKILSKAYSVCDIVANMTIFGILIEVKKMNAHFLVYCRFIIMPPPQPNLDIQRFNYRSQNAGTNWFFLKKINALQGSTNFLLIR